MSFQMEKEIHMLEKDLRSSEDQFKSLQTFMNNNTTTFSAALKPILLQKFPQKYLGKTGNQNLLRDIRYIKLTTSGNIPQNIKILPTSTLERMIESGRQKVHINYADIDVKFEKYTSPIAYYQVQPSLHHQNLCPTYAPNAAFEWQPETHHHQYPPPTCTQTSETIVCNPPLPLGKYPENPPTPE